MQVWEYPNFGDMMVENIEMSVSPTFPIVSKAKLYEFLALARLDEVEAEVNLRKWVREFTNS
jgi:hypothetical protein